MASRVRQRLRWAMMRISMRGTFQRRALLALLFLLLLSVLLSLGVARRPAAGPEAQAQPGPPAPPGARLRVEVDGRMYSRLVARRQDGERALGELRPSDWVVASGRDWDTFSLQQTRHAPVRDELGRGLRVELSGQGGPLRKQLVITYYDDFPDAAVIEARYTNTGAQPLTVARWIQRRFLAAGAGDGGAGPAFWSFQSGSYEQRPDWVLPLGPGSSQRNYMGMNASDYGGGTPVSVVWRRDLGVAVGHLETTPRLVSLPVAVRRARAGEAAGAELGIEEEVNRRLGPGETLATLRTFVSVQPGDHFTPLAAYRRMMIRRGLRFPAAREAFYDPIWCGWGYGREVTAAQITGTLGKAAALGFRWAVLDDGWQTNEGDWKLDPKKFPDGDADMVKLTAGMRAAGMRPMLWWAPLAADPGSELLARHRDWLLLDRQGRPQKISWWDAYYLCPAHPPVRAYTEALVGRFLGDWGYQGLKIDGQHLNAAPPCHNPAHRHDDPRAAFEQLPAFWQGVRQAAERARAGALIELCPCGTAYAFHTLPHLDMPVASDPTSSWQIRSKGKTLKALAGSSVPYFGDHVELSDGGDDFASTVGVGGVVGSQFTLAELIAPGRSEARKYVLTPDKERAFARWLAIYRGKQLARGEYLGALYDIGFDRPEAHAIAKDDRVYYAFFAQRWDGPLALRGLAPRKRYCVRDFVNDRGYGQAIGPAATVAAEFVQHLLLEAVPAPASAPTCKQ
jgi:alpha-galactosidase